MSTTKITLLQYASTKRVRKLIKSPFIDKKVINQLKKFLKCQSKDTPNTYIVNYDYSQNSIHGSGRYMREGGQFPKEVTWYIANNKLVDLDFVNCQPNIIQQCFEMNKIE